MGFMDVAESGLLYGLVIFGILFVLAFACFYLVKSWARAKELGYTKAQLNSVVSTSISTSVVPSIAIIVGFFTLAAVMGVPWPWWRLSVVGAVGYELMAANMAVQTQGLTLGAESLRAASSTDFVLVMYVMTVGIIGGLLASVFISKKVQAGTMKMKDKDQRWGALGTSTFMLTILAVFTLPMILTGGTYLLTYVTSLIITILLSILIKATGWKWLGNFVLAISLLLSMALSVVWFNLLGF